MLLSGAKGRGLGCAGHDATECEPLPVERFSQCAGWPGLSVGIQDGLLLAVLSDGGESIIQISLVTKVHKAHSGDLIRTTLNPLSTDPLDTQFVM